MDRSQLIDRKHEVIAEIRRIRRELDRLPDLPEKKYSRRRQQLEGRLQALTTEEYRLRLAIDRSH